MRSRIVEYLESLLNTELINYLIPTGMTMYFVAIISVMWLMVSRSKEVNLTFYYLLGAVSYGLIGGFIGARVFYLVEHFDRILIYPDIIFSLSGGTTSWGAYMGGLISFTGYLYSKRLPVFSYLDVLASSLGIGPFLGRWSCFLSGCCHGTISNVPWAVRYPYNSSAYKLHYELNLIESSSDLSLAVHPVQLYFSISALTVFIITTLIWKKYRHFSGITFLSYWVLYCCFRFFLEFFREDPNRYTSIHLNLGQLVCITILIIAAPILVRLIKKKSIFY